MKNSIDLQVLKTIYKQYKDYLLPTAIIIVSLILFFYLIIPQFGNVSVLQKQIQEEKERLAILQNNLNYITSVNQQSLTSDFNSVSLTLPKEKDFVGVLSAVSEASGKSSISLGDYQFKVGELLNKKTSTRSLPFLEIKLSLLGNSSDLLRFIDQLQKTAPISEVIDGGLVGNTASLTVHFYYAPLPMVNLQNDVSIKLLSTSDKALLGKLADWNNLKQTAVIVPQGTISGELNSSGPFQ